MKKNNNIPEHWEMASLVDDLPFIKTGVQRYDGVKKYYSTGSIKEESLTEEGEYTFDKKPSRANRIGVKGDVLQARMKNTQKAFIINSNLEGQLFSTGFFQIRGIEGMLSSEYIYYYLTSKTFNQIKDDLSSGSTQSAINDENAKKLFIPLAPYTEQLKIVSKLDEIFSDLDKGIDDLKTANEQLKVYRQSIFKNAFEGKLTNKKVPKNNLPKTWKWVKSGDFFEFVTSGSRGWAKYYSKKGAIFIRITNLNFDTLDLDLSENKIQYVNPPNNSEGTRTKVQEGDFLFSITGYLGMFAIAPKLENAYVNQHVCLCRPKKNFNPKYLGYWIISKSGGNHFLNENKKGAVKAGLNLDDLKSFPVPICDIKEQNNIVLEIENRLNHAAKMEKIIEENILQAETLRQSILNQAYSGKLIEFETDNEIAKNLLSNIKKEKERIISEEKERVRKDRPIYNKYKKMNEYKEILEILASSKEPISSKKLWEKSIYYKDIDAFYANLKKLVDEGKIKEAARDGKETYIELI